MIDKVLQDSPSFRGLMMKYLYRDTRYDKAITSNIKTKILLYNGHIKKDTHGLIKLFADKLIIYQYTLQTQR